MSERRNIADLKNMNPEDDENSEESNEGKFNGDFDFWINDSNWE